jgi:hypothetical protein
MVDMNGDAVVRLTFKVGYGWSARHLASGVASQGDSESEALRALAEALKLHRRGDYHAVEADDDWYDRYEVSPK